MTPKPQPPTPTPQSPPHIFGIRHHGPGSARSLRRALEALQPDAILVEGPPDAAEVLPLLMHAEMQPPVALLVYVPDQPQRAVFYPFAVFSPEWQALHYGLTHGITVRFMDLPHVHQLALAPQAAEESQAEPTPNPQPPTPDSPTPYQDPLGALAEAAGYSDSERWWEHMVEQRQDSADLFAAILEAMTALREELPPSNDPHEEQREAYMRQTIRAAQKEGFQRIAVVCGAWHAPVLANMPPDKQDKTTLKGLPKVKTQATWVPWTYSRLAYTSGYGAGIQSPGWYHHLWSTTDQVIIRWMTRVARLLRAQDLDASSAHVIEAVRLAEALAALREHPLPGLPELTEATRTVLCSGSDVPLALIQEQLIVSDTMGEVPDETPMVPLQRDLQQQQRRLQLSPGRTYDGKKPLELDLRKPTDLERSHLLHRLNLLEIPWGQTMRIPSNKKGTFHEFWHVQWQSEFAVRLIEAGVWGNTIVAAATALTNDTARKAQDLPTLTHLIDRVLLADLPDSVGYLMTRLQAEAAVASDVAHLMAALPPLANVLRYGNVRKTDTSMVARVVDGMVVRVCVNLPLACASLNDEAAAAMFKHIVAFHSAVALLQNAAHQAAWYRVLRHLTNQTSVHGLVQGRCCRLLLDAGELPAEEAARQMGLALSMASAPAQAAAWLEGFLKDSGLILLYDEKLFGVLDEWVTALPGETFTALLPLLRRTFATFEAAARRQMGQRVRRGRLQTSSAAGATPIDIDPQRAAAVLPLVGQLLGLETRDKEAQQ